MGWRNGIGKWQWMQIIDWFWSNLSTSHNGEIIERILQETDRNATTRLSDLRGAAGPIVAAPAEPERLWIQSCQMDNLIIVISTFWSLSFAECFHRRYWFSFMNNECSLSYPCGKTVSFFTWFGISLYGWRTKIKYAEGRIRLSTKGTVSFFMNEFAENTVLLNG